MRRRRNHVPIYRLHKQSGQAVVTLTDGLGNRRDDLLGRHGTPESRAEYVRVLAEWEATGRRLRQPAAANPADLTVNELIVAYWKHAEAYYGFNRNPDRGDAACLRDALRVVKEVYGRSISKDFGPLALKAVRKTVVDKGWSRNYINAQVDRVRRMFRWAAEKELLPGSVYQNLKAVAGLRRGKTEARETEKVKPVPPQHVEAVLPHLRPVVAAMVRLQLLVGCRPEEVCVLRPLDIDTRNPSCWVYRPGSDRGANGAHKTAHHGHDRLILIGPRAQEVLRPHLGTELDAYCFSPEASEAQRNAEQKAARKTPLWPSHQRRRRKVQRRRRAPRDRYDTAGYRRAIKRACRKAGVPPWSPNRLRHTRATELRPFGLDVTKTILGHTKVETTQVYAEKDLQAAMELVARIG